MNPTFKFSSPKKLVDLCQCTGYMKWPIAVSPQNVQASFFLRWEFNIHKICSKIWLHTDSGKKPKKTQTTKTKKPSKNPQGVFNYVLTQGISHTEQDSHRVDVEQIPLTFAPAIQRGQ